MTDKIDSGVDQTRSEQTEAITADQWARYVHEKKCVQPCSACGVTDWAFPLHMGKPELLMMPSARDARVADWFFQMSCDNCGSQRFIGAAYVWAYCYPEEAAKE
jgi:hypothetical protein